MKIIPRQKVWLVIVLAVNLALWLIPSDVVEEIARQRHVMLGRYSRPHFAWNIIVLVISLVSFYIDWSTGATYKRRWFQVMATLVFLTPSLAVVDFVLRKPDVEHYVRDSLAYHRPPGAVFHQVFVDRPEARRSYPHAPPGYGTVDCRLRTDRRGYRNQSNLETYDVVVLGDSFAEGSNVSDEHPWPVRLASQAGLTVYNLGMSGYDPFHYLESLKEVGWALKPRVVLCLFYEGNDFRSDKTDEKRKRPSLSMRVEEYIGRSPVIGAIDKLLIKAFGPVNSDGALKDAGKIDWLPLAIPQGPEARYYAFEPKQLRDLYESREEFAADKHWLNPQGQIGEMNKLCRDSGCQLVVVFAPTKAHVTLPIVADRLVPEKVRAFTAISYKDELPEPREFLRKLLENADAREEVVGDWCRRQAIPFVSLTGSLRKAAAHGKQVYFTYDQHWTPDGHEVVAQTVHRYLVEHHLTEAPTVSQH